jgi:hypothetical protein
MKTRVFMLKCALFVVLKNSVLDKSEFEVDKAHQLASIWKENAFLDQVELTKLGSYGADFNNI